MSTRDANASDEIVSTKFSGTSTRGFAAPNDPRTAVCLRPGTEIAFEKNAKVKRVFLNKNIGATLARFRQIHLDDPYTHHDALEFSNGAIVKVTDLVPGQKAWVVQLPADPAAAKSEPHSENQTLRQNSAEHA